LIIKRQIISNKGDKRVRAVNAIKISNILFNKINAS